MTESGIFLSYSRGQLYFVEALSLQLQKAGLSIWMDLQRLQPGEDWQEQINAALQACSALVLVASRQALASPYVRAEWQGALAAGKPVYVALYEAVDLPPELQGASLVDFRGPFKAAVHRLAIAITNAQPVHEVTPRPGWFNLPTRMPPAITGVFLALILEALAAPWILPLVRPPDFSPLVWMFEGPLICGFCLWLAWQLLHHRWVLPALNGALVIPLVTYGFYLISIMQGSLSEEAFLLHFLWMGFTVLFGVIISYALSYTLGPEFLRWSLTGPEAELQQMRRWSNNAGGGDNMAAFSVTFRKVFTARAAASTAHPVMEAAPPQERTRQVEVSAPPQTYSLYYAAADAPVAMSVRRAFAGQALREAAEDGEVSSIILTENLPRPELQSLLESPRPHIVLLAGNLLAAGDPLLEQAVRLQLVDYRDRSEKILPALAHTLQDPANSNLSLGAETTPKPFNRLVLPLGVRGAGFVVLTIGAYLILGGLAAIAFSLMRWRSLLPLDVIGLPFGVIFVRLGRVYWNRSVPSVLFLPPFLFSVWVGISLFFNSFFLFALQRPFAFTDTLLPLSRLFGSQFSCLTCLPSFIFLPVIALRARLGLRDWLPAPAPKPNRELGFQTLPDPDLNRWTWWAWGFAAFLVFGLGPAMYMTTYFVTHVLRAQ
jgi:hypothetical protein